jgi:hypothetical protein
MISTPFFPPVLIAHSVSPSYDMASFVSSNIKYIRIELKQHGKN